MCVQTEYPPHLFRGLKCRPFDLVIQKVPRSVWEVLHNLNRVCVYVCVCVCVCACTCVCISSGTQVNKIEPKLIKKCGALHVHTHTHTHTPVFSKGDASLYKHFVSLSRGYTATHQGVTGCPVSRVRDIENYGDPILCRFVPLAGHPETRARAPASSLFCPFANASV